MYRIIIQNTIRNASSRIHSGFSSSREAHAEARIVATEGNHVEVQVHDHGNNWSTIGVHEAPKPVANPVHYVEIASYSRGKRR